MIERKELLSLNFLHKSPFTGSYQGMRYRLVKETEEGKETEIKAVLWEEPYSYEATPEDKKVSKSFPFSEEGMTQVTNWLNESWQTQQTRWANAKKNW